MKKQPTGRKLKGSKTRDGHIAFHLGLHGKKVVIQAGRLILMAFVGMPEANQECCHNNGTPDDNRLENLRWDTHLSNNKDRIRHGTYKRGAEHHFSKFDDKLVNDIRTKVVTKEQALTSGVSMTHYYRILRGER